MVQKPVALALAIAIPLSLGAGAWASDFVRRVITDFGLLDDSYPRCVDGKVCVGAPAPQVFGWVETDRHGVTGFFCPERPDGLGRWILMDGVVAGERCKQDRYVVELRGPTERTLIEVAKGRVTKITVGPLHALDL